MPTISPFTPQAGTTVGITASAASQSAALPTGGGTQIRVCNTGSVIVYVAFGASTVTASSTTDMPILATTSEIFTVDILSKLTYAAVFGTSAASQIVMFTRGEGF